MELTTTVAENSKEYIVTVTKGQNAFETRWGKDQDIQVSKVEAERLAQMEIDKQAEPTPVDL